MRIAEVVDSGFPKMSDKHPIDIPVAVSDFLKRHFFGRELQDMQKLFGEYRFADAFQDACEFVQPIYDGGAVPEEAIQELQRLSYQTTVHARSIVRQPIWKQEKDSIKDLIYGVGRCLLLDLRECIKDALPDFTAHIISGIEKAAETRKFESDDKLTELNLTYIENLDAQEDALENNTPKRSKPNTSEKRFICLKLESYLIQLGQWIEEDYEMIVSSKEWENLFIGSHNTSDRVRVFRKKTDYFVLLMFELVEKGYIGIDGGRGRNGPAPLILKYFVDENGKVLIKKPKDMRNKIKSQPDKYKQVIQDVTDILADLARLEMDQMDDLNDDSGRND